MLTNATSRFVVITDHTVVVTSGNCGVNWPVQMWHIHPLHVSGCAKFLICQIENL